MLTTTSGSLVQVAEKLRIAGLRPTKQRLLLGNLLWSGPQPRHVTAEQLHNEARKQGVQVSLATVYNTLHQLTKDGLLRETVIDGGRVYFDTNTTDHHHIVNVQTGEIQDVCATKCSLGHLQLPPGVSLDSVEIVVRVKPAA